MFEWKKEFELGIAEIDEQHKHFWKSGITSMIYW